MNDFSEIESELKKLRPAPVSNEFDRAGGEAIPGRINDSGAAAQTCVGRKLDRARGWVWASPPQPVS